MLVGSFGLAVLAVTAVAVFDFGMPVHDRYTHRVISHTDVARGLEFLAVGFLAFFAIGAALLLVSKQPDA